MIKAVIFDVDGTLVGSNGEAWAVAVYRDVSDLLDNYEGSPLAGSVADVAGARN